MLLGAMGASIVLSVMSAAYGQDKAAPSTQNVATAQKHRDIKKDKIVFLGNSITLHGPSEAIGWTGNWGMAASSEEKDYVHLMVKALSNSVPGANTADVQAPKYLVRNIADFERGFADYSVEENLKELLDFKPDLIILAIGENVAPLNTEELKAQFHDRVTKLLKAFQKDGDGPSA
jgi:alpha-galactosidase